MRARESEILFRNIIPLRRWSSDNELFASSIKGEFLGEEFKVEIVKSTGYEEAKNGILKYWTFNEVSTCELFDDIQIIGKCNYFVIIDNYVRETDKTRVMSNSLASVNIAATMLKALLLFCNGLGPEIDKQWGLSSPFIGNSIGSHIVTMNPFMCEKGEVESNRTPKFESVFNSLLSYNWKGSQFDKVLELAHEALSGSLRTTNYAHSFSLLTMAFESLFTKSEDDWAGGSKRLARLVGNTKGEVTKIRCYLNDGNQSIRGIRNLIVHGNIGFKLESIKEGRITLAKYISGAMILLIEKFDGSDQVDNYYDYMENVADERFSNLPNN